MSRRWLFVLAFCLSTTATGVFRAMVLVALPDIQADLDASFAQLQWILNGFVLALIALLMAGGYLADRFGRRRVYVAGVGTAAGSALLCAVAPNATLLDLGCAAMGAGWAVAFPAGVSTIGNEFSGRARALAFGFFGTAVGVGLALGPILGGLIIEGFSWRFIFVALLLLYGSAFAIVLLQLRAVHDVASHERRFDWGGLASFGAAVFLLNWALIRGDEDGYGDPLIVAMFVAGGVLLVAFVLIELAYSRPRSSRPPMLELSLFRRPAFAGNGVAAFFSGMLGPGLLLFLGLYLGGLLRNEPIDRGLKLLPLTAVALVISPLVGRLMARVPIRVLLAVAMLVMATGDVLMHGVTARSEWTALLAGFILVGVGTGIHHVTLPATAVSVVPRERAGLGAGFHNVCRQLGTALGVSIYGVIFQARVAERLPELPGGAGDKAADLVAAGNLKAAAAAVPPEARGDLADAAPAAFTAGLNEVFLVAAGLGVVGAALALALIRARDFYTPIAVRPVPAPDEGAVAVATAPAAYGTGAPLAPRRPGERAAEAAWATAYALAVLLSAAALVVSVVAVLGAA